MKHGVMRVLSCLLLGIPVVLAAALIAAYALAKVLETGDREVLHLTQGLVSGHTLKHVFAALAVLAVLLPLVRRRSPAREP
jgi:hypothetical protein